MSNRSPRISAKSPPDGFINTRADTPEVRKTQQRSLPVGPLLFCVCEWKKKNTCKRDAAAEPIRFLSLLILRAEAQFIAVKHFERFPGASLPRLYVHRVLGPWEEAGGPRREPTQAPPGHANSTGGERWELNPRPPRCEATAIAQYDNQAQLSAPALKAACKKKTSFFNSDEINKT